MKTVLQFTVCNDFNLSVPALLFFWKKVILAEQFLFILIVVTVVFRKFLSAAAGLHEHVVCDTPYTYKIMVVCANHTTIPIPNKDLILSAM